MAAALTLYAHQFCVDFLNSTAARTRRPLQKAWERVQQQTVRSAVCGTGLVTTFVHLLREQGAKLLVVVLFVHHAWATVPRMLSLPPFHPSQFRWCCGDQRHLDMSWAAFEKVCAPASEGVQLKLDHSHYVGRSPLPEHAADMHGQFALQHHQHHTCPLPFPYSPACASNHRRLQTQRRAWCPSDSERWVHVPAAGVSGRNGPGGNRANGTS